MMSQKNTPGNTMLWDEILKAIVDAMPEQLFRSLRKSTEKIIQKEPPLLCLPRNPPHTGRLRTRRLVLACLISRF